MTCAICGRPIGGPDKYCITCSTQKRQAVRTPAVVLAVGLSLVGVKVAVEGLGSTLSDVVAFFRPAPAPGQPPPVQAVQAPANQPPVKTPEPVAPPAAGPGPVASTEVAKAESAPEGKSPAAPPASPPRPDEESAEEKAARVAKRVDELDLQLDDRNRRNDALRELAALGPKLGPAALPFLPELRRVQKELRRFGKADFQNAEADETLSSAIGRIEAEESPQGTR